MLLFKFGCLSANFVVFWQLLLPSAVGSGIMAWYVFGKHCFWWRENQSNATVKITRLSWETIVFLSYVRPSVRPSTLPCFPYFSWTRIDNTHFYQIFRTCTDQDSLFSPNVTEPHRYSTSCVLLKYQRYKNINWAPKETIHSIYLKLFYSKIETLTFVVRNVILGV